VVNLFEIDLCKKTACLGAELVKWRQDTKATNKNELRSSNCHVCL